MVIFLRFFSMALPQLSFGLGFLEKSETPEEMISTLGRVMEAPDGRILSSAAYDAADADAASIERIDIDFIVQI
jgi:hypothetical protein